MTDGQLNLEFQGENWACSVSAVVIFPVEESVQGRKFLAYAEAKRRFYFDNYFKRVLPLPAGEPAEPTAEDRRRGFVLFQPDFMRDVASNGSPLKNEIVSVLRGEAFAGEYEPVTLALLPLADLGRATIRLGNLEGPGGSIPAGAIDVGYVSYRISRVTSEGSVYTISPRLIMPGDTVELPKGMTRRFWLTVRTPGTAGPGVYKGSVSIATAGGRRWNIPLEFRVRAGTLDPVDIPAGPFGHAIRIPWFDDDHRAAAFNQRLVEKSLRRMREYGFTACTGMPSIAFRGFDQGKPVLDFSMADRQMTLAKELGFLAVTTYGAGVSGYDAYYQDSSAMTAGGFQDYAAFVRAIYSTVQHHAAQQGWLPVYYNLADEPLGDDTVQRRKTPRPIAGPSPRARRFSREPAASRAPRPMIPTSGFPERSTW